MLQSFNASMHLERAMELVEYLTFVKMALGVFTLSRRIGGTLYLKAIGVKVRARV
jgi:hypothetical protein